MINIGKKYDGLVIFLLKFKEIRLIVLNEWGFEIVFFFLYLDWKSVLFGIVFLFVLWNCEEINDRF